MQLKTMRERPPRLLHHPAGGRYADRGIREAIENLRQSSGGAVGGATCDYRFRSIIGPPTRSIS
jgi:hypothetical protein